MTMMTIYKFHHMIFIGFSNEINLPRFRYACDDDHYHDIIKIMIFIGPIFNLSVTIIYKNHTVH